MNETSFFHVANWIVCQYLFMLNISMGTRFSNLSSSCFIISVLNVDFIVIIRRKEKKNLIFVPSTNLKGCQIYWLQDISQIVFAWLITFTFLFDQRQCLFFGQKSTGFEINYLTKQKRRFIRHTACLTPGSS
jgi:hypothetical protein